MAYSLMNGRFSGINAARFRTNKGITEAIDSTTGETVILKSFTIVHDDIYEAAKDEMETLRQLEHKNIVRFICFIDILTPNWSRCQMCFIAMEHCEGGSLKDWIARMKSSGRRTTAAEASMIAAQLISALSFCHIRDVGHLDLKPDNVFCSADFIEIKLGDFGSALTIESATESLRIGSSRYTTNGVDALTPLYAAPEFYSGEKVDKSPRLDIWGLALILQEVLTLEHAFGRIGGRPALHTQIQTNIQLHERPESTRTSIFAIFGETDEFSEFETLLEKCLHSDRKRRPRNAIKLRNERVLADFLNRIENGARPCDLVRPPFEDEKDTKIRDLKEKIAIKERKIVDLENRLNSETDIRLEIIQRDKIIETENKEIAKMTQNQSKLESDLRENKKIIEQLANEHDLERENWKNETAKMQEEISKFKSELDGARKMIEQLKMKNESERREFQNETKKMDQKIKLLENNLKKQNEKKQTENQERILRFENEKRNCELEKLRKELGEKGGAGHFWSNDRMIGFGGERNWMKQAELEKVRLLSFGEKKINLKFQINHNWEVAEAGWTLQFKTANNKYCGGDGKYFFLWIGIKNGDAKFKATAQQINNSSGEEENRQELESKKDGTRQVLKYEYVSGLSYVRFNITFL